MKKKNKIYYNKNEAKKQWKKYVIIALLCFPILVLLNITLFKNFSNFWQIFADIVFLLIVLGVFYFNKNYKANKNDDNSGDKHNKK